ncbi:MAG: hypothetical protein E7262_00715 [Lachnospiraceae bacterium]|nr:hypothetical protein [Lachnospiraceae bacterium]
MARVDTIQHTFRVNLNNPKHLLVHQTLVNLNLDIHKSRANFIIECLYKIIQGTEIQELTNIADEDREKLVTRKEVMKMNNELKDEIEKEVMEKVTSMLLGAMVGNAGNAQTIIAKEEVDSRVEYRNKTVDDTHEDSSMDETLIKMADMWSEM